MKVRQAVTVLHGKVMNKMPENDPPGLAAPHLAFGIENGRLAQLAGAAPVIAADASVDIAEGIWLSVEPQRGAFVAFQPLGQGFRLSLPDAGLSGWVSLSIAISRDTLASGRYLGLRAVCDSVGFLSFRLCLRHLLNDGGFADRFCSDYAISSGGARDLFCYLAIGRSDIARSHGGEVHLFFQGAQFDATFRQVEILLMT